MPFANGRFVTFDIDPYQTDDLRTQMENAKEFGSTSYGNFRDTSAPNRSGQGGSQGQQSDPLAQGLGNGIGDALTRLLTPEKTTAVQGDGTGSLMQQPSSGNTQGAINSFGGDQAALKSGDQSFGVLRNQGQGPSYNISQSNGVTQATGQTGMYNGPVTQGPGILQNPSTAGVDPLTGGIANGQYGPHGAEQLAGTVEGVSPNTAGGLTAQTPGAAPGADLTTSIASQPSVTPTIGSQASTAYPVNYGTTTFNSSVSGVAGPQTGTILGQGTAAPVVPQVGATATPAVPSVGAGTGIGTAAAPATTTVAAPASTGLAVGGPSGLASAGAAGGISSAAGGGIAAGAGTAAAGAGTAAAAGAGTAAAAGGVAAGAGAAAAGGAVAAGAGTAAAAGGAAAAGSGIAAALPFLAML